MYKIKFTEAAAKEVENAGLWYAKQQDNLDERFKKSISSALEKLQSDKVIHADTYQGLCRVFVKNFPYSIYFKKDIARKLIIVFGVLHTKQNRSPLDERI